IVGVCDREPLMAKQLCERLSVARSFSDVDDLLDSAHPDVVHITTPPASHFDIARACLDRGCHVYIEKPFTIRAGEAEALVALASIGSGGCRAACSRTSSATASRGLRNSSRPTRRR